MSRFRQDARTSGDKSARIDGGTRPPAHLMPAVFVPLIAEYDRVNSLHGAAQTAAHGYRNGWAVQLENAQRDDARANALALRADSTDGTKTTNADTLIRARDDAEARYASLADARSLVETDVYEMLRAECDNPEYGKNLDAARAALVKTTAGVQAAVTKAVTACAIYEWVHYLKWDGTECISLEELHPALVSIGPGLSNMPPVQAARIIQCLTQIADPTKEN